MPELNRPARLNRALLALTGLLLLVAGGYAVAANRGRLGWVDAADALTPGTGAPPRWVLLLIAVGAVMVGLLCLRWLLTQVFRLPRAVEWELATGSSAGATLLDSSVAAAAVSADIESYSDVRSVSAVLTGPARAPDLHLIVTAEPGADITALRRRILGEAVPRLRTALEVGVMPVSMELRYAEKAARAS
ncbi:alkaline shock response membrane anchor protein AmaP [Nocardia sp. SYP-A9097]|uniref:alkaline shock response membrane anchor protein AmaP n=1 Tax=Nocardia sp. SYP-A9097 TaxID=2663237 RepID=UPI00129B421E|nr:alkaline shock response membrane anchor protein AmaP [Nocardia sp. SYP-A9097]MRH93067.1 alkaline shock response membrane anchor protein AmaP [Nocardia sp. SYP-A9097]